MNPPADPSPTPRTPSNRWVPALVVALVLTALGTVIYRGVTQFRGSLRQQMLDHDGEVLDAVARLEPMGQDSTASMTEYLQHPMGQLAFALRLSQLKEGILAVRLFDPQGRFVMAVPATVRESALDADTLARVARLEPSTRYDPDATLDQVFLRDAGQAEAAVLHLPVVSVVIPLHALGQSQPLGAAELIADGTPLARQYARLDDRLWRQGVWTFLWGGGAMTFALLWAFRRLQRLNRRLHAQATALRRANQELTLAAKTSALGAVTAHVVHGLTSPLQGLQQFVATRAGDDADWQDALRGTERMQSLLGDILRVLGEESVDARYQLPLEDVAQLLADKMEPVANAAGVRFTWHCAAARTLPNRDANLVLLVLENLIQNAIQALPRGRSVQLSLQSAPHGIRCTVADEGPGLPEAVRQNLFAPLRSRRRGGHGLGLALSRHLARHLGAELQLLSTGPQGTVFALDLPHAVIGTPADPAPGKAAEPAAVTGP